MRSLQKRSEGGRIVVVKGFSREGPLVPREVTKHSMEPTVAWVGAMRCIICYSDTSTTWSLCPARMSKFSDSIKERDAFLPVEKSLSRWCF